MHLQAIRATTFRANVTVSFKGQATDLLPFLVIGGRCSAAPEMALLSPSDVGVVLASACERATYLLLRLLRVKLSAAYRARTSLRMVTTPSGSVVALLRAIFWIVALPARLIDIELLAAMQAVAFLSRFWRKLPTYLLVAQAAACWRTTYLIAGLQAVKLCTTHDTGTRLSPIRSPSRGLIAGTRTVFPIGPNARRRSVEYLATVLTGTILSVSHVSIISQLCEKGSYYRQAVANLRRAEQVAHRPTLFDLAGEVSA